MYYIGIDPGKKGAIAIIDEKRTVIARATFSEETYIQILREIDAPCIVCLEQVGARPGQGVTSMFHFGENFGWIRGVLQALSIPYQTVTPLKWKREFSVTSDKGSSVKACQKLFPSADLHATSRCTTPHDGIAEALLMAEYARRKFGGGNANERAPF